MTETMTLGDRAAERAGGIIGSWRFVGIQAFTLFIWILFNSLQATNAIHFDPFPFILCNFALSFQAAFTGPMLLIASNVAARRDRAQAQRIEELVQYISQLVARNEAHEAEQTRLLAILEGLVEQHQAHDAAQNATLTEVVSQLTLLRGSLLIAPSSPQRSEYPWWSVTPPPLTNGTTFTMPEGASFQITNTTTGTSSAVLPLEAPDASRG